MCGAYGFSVKDAKDVYDRFEVVNTLEDLKPSFKVTPGRLNPIITAHSPKQISRMLWGLIPFWARDDKSKYSTINAKAETAASLPTYREPFRKHRCLIPATGFYEPDKVHFTEKERPYPWYYFRFKDQEIFAFAGLYDVWTDKATGKEIHSYTLITTEPNEIVGRVHGRMPVILSKEDEETWINPDIVEPEHVQQLLKPYPANLMEGWRAPDAARSPRSLDHPDFIKPIGPLPD
jgi:putative SOS response-associated peptidase YedK